MKVTRQELEDMWVNMPYGAFTKMLKSRKNLQKYSVTTEAKELVLVDTEVVDIWAKDISQAHSLAHSASCNVLRRRLGASMYDAKYVFSTKAKEVR